MFFSRKSNKPVAQLSRLVADYLSLDAKATAPWCDEQAGELVLTLPFCFDTQVETLRDYLKQNWQGDAMPSLRIDQQVHSHKTASETEPVTNVRNIIAVASGKGGVGKSSTAINLAFALQQEGASVGILDADIYGPSIPIMLGNKDAHPSSSDNKHMQPLEAWGMVANSIGYLVPEDDAAVWRGPMASRALKQILDETLWPVLDYLIVDMPPGTGDIQLTMAQQVPLTGAVVVSTPQDLALADAKKGISMFDKVNVPVLGLIENMSYFQCDACGEKSYIFSHGGGESLAERHGLPLLGAFPLDMKIREHADAGSPLLVAEPGHELSEAYRAAARALSLNLALNTPVRDNEQGHIRGNPIGIQQQ